MDNKSLGVNSRITYFGTVKFAKNINIVTVSGYYTLVNLFLEEIMRK